MRHCRRKRYSSERVCHQLVTVLNKSSRVRHLVDVVGSWSDSVCSGLALLIEWRAVDTPHAIEVIRPSIYQISIYRGLPSDSIVLGTGFQVAPAWLVTAKHVTDPVSDLIAQQGGWLAAGMAVGNMDSPVRMHATFTIEAASIVDTDAENDLSLLRLRFRPRPFVQTPSQAIDVTAGASVSLDVDRPNEGEM